MSRLLEAGANPALRSHANELPEDVAARLGQLEAVAALRAYDKPP
jgi:hypothetical protein